MEFLSLAGVAGTLKLALDLSDRFRGREKGNIFGLILEGKKRGYYLTDDVYSFEFVADPDDADFILITVTRESNVRRFFAMHYSIHDQKTLQTEYETKLLQHLIDGTDRKGSEKETFDRRPDCKYPLISHIMESLPKEFHRQSKLEYRIRYKDQIQLDIEVECPTGIIEAHFRNETGCLRRVHTDKIFGRGMYNKNISEKWIEENKHCKVQIPKIQTRSLIQFKIQFTKKSRSKGHNIRHDDLPPMVG